MLSFRDAESFALLHRVQKAVTVNLVTTTTTFICGGAQVFTEYENVKAMAEGIGAEEEVLRRTVESRGGHVVLLRGSSALRAGLDPWGPLGDAVRLMGSIKRQFDPEGVLSEGRWPLNAGGAR